MKIESDYFGGFENEIVKVFTLKNTNGIEIEILNYGGIIKSIKTPNKNGVFENITLGYNSLEKYVKSSPFFGAIIGRFGNRIANGKFSLDNNEYNLKINNPPNNLHGGNKGFDKVIWKPSTKVNENSVSLILEYFSKDLEEGFPGNLKTTVIYTLTSNNSLDIDYKATTDKKTIVNLTNHAYFNLSGNFKEDVLNHQLKIESRHFLPVNKNLIPTSEFINVKDSPFDFTNFKTIGKDINANHQQLKYGSGYDHCWVLNNKESKSLVATAFDIKSGRKLEVFSTEPGVQFYSGNHLKGNYSKRTGFCLETQHYPDSPNQPNFPSVVLSPDEVYTSKTSFKFSVK